MIDDLTHRGVEEPYRCFTSRAEYRLLLGVDTVLARPLPHGRRLGLIGEEEYGEAMKGEERLQKAEGSPQERLYNPTPENPPASSRKARGGGGLACSTHISYCSVMTYLLHRPLRWLQKSFRSFQARRPPFSRAVMRYEGYIRREIERLERSRPFETTLIPEGFVYAGVPGLSREVVEKCTRKKPRTLGEAARIPAVTPAAVAIISAHVSRRAGATPAFP